jgi:hypothetical protein
MADLTAARDTESRSSPLSWCFDPVCVTGATIYKGALVQLTTAGLANKAGAANPKMVLGRALETVVSAVAGQTIRVECGVFGWNGAGSITAADIGSPAYVVDDNSVTDVDGGSALIAGTIVDVSEGQTWVLSFPPIASGISAAGG